MLDLKTKENIIKQFNSACELGKIDNIKELSLTIEAAKLLPTIRVANFKDHDFFKGLELVIMNKKTALFQYFIETPNWENTLKEYGEVLYERTLKYDAHDITQMFHNTKFLIPHILPYLLYYGKIEDVISIIENKQFNIVEDLKNPKSKYYCMFTNKLSSLIKSRDDEVLVPYLLSLDKNHTYPLFHQQIPRALFTATLEGKHNTIEALCQNAVKLNSSFDIDLFISVMKKELTINSVDTISDSLAARITEPFKRIMIEKEKEELERNLAVSTPHENRPVKPKSILKI